ncbi:TorF family putative porin [Massilia pinisoli]|uniref:TorF family putative porin n=1 Tax=Massilia pinisoli TaxID=1772194 RepID=A0ABT1ZJU3_9BURK|nr:TorF family putative porin [Massilia pinisoli]MCS0580168.1 TorF family putative porin [Massilia pinisoli]
MSTRHRPALAPTRRLAPFACLLAACTFAHAGEATPDAPITAETPTAESPLSATVSVSSQYISRGIRQTWGRPAAMAAVDYAHPSGWSAGTSVINVDDRFIEKGSVEWDLYGGYSGNAGPIGWSAMVYWYKYPGARISATDTSFDYGELSGGISWKSLYARYNYTFSRDFFGIQNARGTGYLDVGADQPLTKSLTLNLHAGDGRVAGSGNGIWDWRDVKAGLTHKLEDGWTVAVNYTRALGATGVYDRYTTGVPRSDGHLAVSNVARRAIVLSLTRKF